MAKDVKKDLAIRDLGRALGKKIARLERHVREIEVASQAAFRSVEDGAIDWYDDDGVLRERIGKQADGSYGRKTFTGDIPPAPTEPDVQVISDGVVAITWDGRWEERYSHVGWRNVQIHLGDTATFTPDRDTQVGAIFAPRGGTVVAVTESDDDNPVWVRLVGMNDAGQTGDPSVAALVDELDEDDLEEEPEELQWEDDDGWTLTTADITAGTVTFGLSHIPEVESLLAWWHPGGLAYAGVPQAPGLDFTVDHEAQTVTWPLTGCEAAGDRLRVYYPYYDLGRSLGFQATGWRYLLVTEADAVDRSATGFDDSAWSTGQGAFGNPTAADGSSFGNGLAWPTPSTSIPVNTGIWLRRSISELPASAADVTVKVRVDGVTTVYWNGTQIGTRSAYGITEVDPIPVPAGLLGGSNILAVHHVDDVEDPTSDFVYIDARIEW